MLPFRRFPWLHFALALSVPKAFSQITPPTYSLGGKTVHVYLASEEIDSLLIENVNVLMTKDAPFRYSYTFTRGGLYDYPDGFYFSDPNHRLFLSKAGLGGSDSPRFLLSDFAGGKEIWIVVDPAGPDRAAPVILTQAPKTINILNPWPMTAPNLAAGNKTRNMYPTPGHCGWFSALLLDTTLSQGHFSEIDGGGTYGKTGSSGTGDFDFAALFAQYGPTLWLNTETNAWAGTFPNVEGTCRYTLTMTVRDFSRDHPDFDFGSLTGEHSVSGMVQPILGPDPGRKPILNQANISKDPAISFSHFDDWWVTDSTRPDPLKNYESCYDLPIGRSNDGLWEYESFRDSPDHGFWPVEGALNRFNETNVSCYVKPPPDSTTWFVNGQRRNGNFCAESHASFVYAPGQTFFLRGDDDVWVFINDKLALDLGGVHTPKSDSVDLDKLGLTAGKSYKWDFFYCDRQPCGSSLQMRTSIRFQQARALYAKPVPGPTPGSVSVEIWKDVGAMGSCASAGSDKRDSVKAANLKYQIIDSSGAVVKDLSNPGTFYSGITIAEPIITVDTTKIPLGVLISGGAFRVIAFDPSNPAPRVEVPFRIPSATEGVKRPRKQPKSLRPGVRFRNLLGRRVPKEP